LLSLNSVDSGPILFGPQITFKETAMTRPPTRQTDSQPFEKEPAHLSPEDAEESSQSIEEAAYYIGLKRNRDSRAGDSSTDWLEAEKAVKENLE
jgi:hypothetical protein